MVSAFLKKWEHVFKTDLVYLLQGGSWLTLAQILIGLIALVTSVAFANFLTRDDYGVYRFLLSALWILTAFSLTGVPTAVSRAVAQGFEGVIKPALRISIAGSVPLLLISLCASGYYFFVAGSALLAIGFIVIGFGGLFLQSAFLYGAYLEGKKQFRLTTVGGIAINLVPALLAFAAFPFTNNPVIFFFLYISGTVLTGLGMYFYVVRRFKPNTTISPDFRNLSLHFSAMNFLFTVTQQIDRMLIFYFLGPAQLAIYSFAISFPEQIKGLFGSISTLAFPKFSQRSLAEIGTNFWGRMFTYTLLILAVTVAYILFAPWFFNTILPAYRESIWYSQLFALSLIMAANTIPSTLLQAHAAKTELYVFNIVSPALQILILCIAIPLGGLLGAVVGRIIGRAFSFGLSALLVYTHTRKHLPLS